MKTHHAFTVKVTTVSAQSADQPTTYAAEPSLNGKEFLEKTSIHSCDQVEIVSGRGANVFYATTDDGSRVLEATLPYERFSYADLKIGECETVRVVVENSNGKTTHAISRYQ